MNRTVILAGLPADIDLAEVAANLDKLFDTDDIGTFRLRELPLCPNKFALDFDDSYDAFSAQGLLDGHYYSVSQGERYQLRAKINSDPRFQCVNKLANVDNYIPKGVNKDLENNCESNSEEEIVDCDIKSENSNTPTVNLKKRRKRARARARKLQQCLAEQKYKTEVGNPEDTKPDLSRPEPECWLKTETTKLPEFPDYSGRKRAISPDRPDRSDDLWEDNHSSNGSYKRSRRKEIKKEVIEEEVILDDELLDELAPELEKSLDHFRRQCRVVLDTQFEDISLTESDRNKVMKSYIRAVAERLKRLKLNRYMVESDIVSEYKHRHPLKTDLALIKKLVNEEVVIELVDSDEDDKRVQNKSDDIWDIVDEVFNTADTEFDNLEDHDKPDIKEEPEDTSYREPSSNITKINIIINPLVSK